MKRRLAAIFNLDMVGYSRLMEVDERRTLLRQAAHRTDLIEASIASHHGRIVKCMGDGLLAEFGSAVDAVECAAAIQRAMPDRESAVPPELRIAYRIGICVGDVVVAEGDIYGTGVIFAVRVQSLAQPGGICISGSAFQQVRNKVELGFEDLGMHAVKTSSSPCMSTACC